MPPGSRRLSISPCSSRSTIAWCSRRRLRRPATPPPVACCASVRQSCSTDAATSAPAVPLLIAIEQLFLQPAQIAKARDAAAGRLLRQLQEELLARCGDIYARGPALDRDRAALPEAGA